MNNLWIFGDSFSSDFDMDYTHQNHRDYMKMMGFDTMKHWPSILAEKLDMNLKNIAKGGNSNYQIFFDFCENIDDINEGDIVIIGWALIGKFIVVDNNQFLNIHPHDMHFHLKMRSSTLEDIKINRKNDMWEKEVRYWEKLISQILNNKKVKFVFWSSEERKLVNDKIDLTKCDTMSNETNNLVQDSHLGMIGHNKLAENFYSIIYE